MRAGPHTASHPDNLAFRERIGIELFEAHLDDLGQLAGRRFDLVCAHGMLMYVDDRRSALHALATLVAPGGQLSATFGNGAALAFRPGIRRDWHAAVAAFGAASYVNELGVKARGRHPDQVAADQRPGHHLVRRPCSPTQPPDEQPPADRAEDRAAGPRRPGRPHRWVPPSRIPSPVIAAPP